MAYTVLNIESDDNRYHYIAEFTDTPEISAIPLSYAYNQKGYYLCDGIDNEVLGDKNSWTQISEDSIYVDETIPSTYNISNLDILFPRFSVETFDNNLNYLVTANTWINGVCIYLKSCIINRMDAIAPLNGNKRFLNDEYYEYIRMSIVDPFYLIYGDEWKSFRTRFCNEIQYQDGLQVNDSASNINITLTPVKKINGVWVKLDGFDTCQSVIPLRKSNNDYLQARLTFDNENGAARFKCRMLFNEVYNGDLDEYLKETYFIDFEDGYKLTYRFMISDANDVYKFASHEFDTPTGETDFELSEYMFDGWENYIEGLSARVLVSITKQDNEIIVISSNKEFITPDVFRFLTQEPVRSIKINELDMSFERFDVVNIIKNEIVNVERPSERTSNMIKPIYIKTQEAGSIRLHPSVNENIVINLDAYKNQVESFLLKIGDTNYYEIGRVNAGIIFKIVGSSLPAENGTYYVLNQDGDLITTGNYTLI